MAGKNKVWNKPQLLILVRKSSAELIYMACKGGTGIGTPIAWVIGCHQGTDPRIPGCGGGCNNYVKS